MKTIVQQVIDTSEIRRINPAWPDRIVQNQGPAELRGDKKAIWRNGKCIGFVGHDGWEVAQ